MIRAVRVVYLNQWGLRAARLAYWLAAAALVRPDDLGAFGLWLAFTAACAFVHPAGFAQGLLTDSSEALPYATRIAAAWSCAVGLALAVACWSAAGSIAEYVGLRGGAGAVRLYGAALPLLFLADVSYRLLQRNGAFARLYACAWLGFAAQAATFALALRWGAADALVIAFLAAALVRGLTLVPTVLHVVWTAPAYATSTRKHRRLALTAYAQQAGAYGLYRGDLLLLGQAIPAAELGGLVIAKQLFEYLKSTVIDPSAEYSLPLLARVRGRPSAPKILHRYRREALAGFGLVTVGGAAAAIGSLLALGSYGGALGLVAAVAAAHTALLFGFTLGQESVSQGQGRRIAAFRITSALVSLGVIAAVPFGALDLLPAYQLVGVLLGALVLVFDHVSARHGRSAARYSRGAVVRIAILATALALVAGLPPLALLASALALTAYGAAVAVAEFGGYGAIVRRARSLRSALAAR